MARCYRLAERGFDAVLAFYERGLRWALRHQPTMLTVTAITVAVNVALFLVIPKGLFPQQDNGLLMGVTEAAQDVSFPEMLRLQTQVNHVLDDDPDVAHYVSFIGSGGFGTGNTGNAFITLSSKPQRKAAAEQVLARLRKKLVQIEGITTYLQARQDVNVGGRLGRTQYQYTVQDANLDELLKWGPRVLEALRRLPQLKDVNTDQQTAGLELDVDIDRDTASRLGVTTQAIDDALYDAYGQRFVATTFTQLNEYHVVLEAAQPYRETPDSLDGIYVSGANHAAVPLAAIATTRPTTTALSINHHGQFPATTISFNLSPGASLGQAVDAIDKAERAIQVPPSVQASFQGTAQAFTSSLRNEPLLVAAALIAVYIVLGMLYESYVHPVTILSTLPSAGIGALVALMLFGVDLSIIAIIGLLLLIGIVKKNAILLIDFAIEAERTRAVAAGGHPARLLQALPAHPDDHVRGALRRASAGHRRRARIGAPAPAGDDHRRRSAGVAAAHPVHDTRRVPGARAAPALGSERAPPGARPPAGPERGTLVGARRGNVAPSLQQRHTSATAAGLRNFLRTPEDAMAATTTLVEQVSGKSHVAEKLAKSPGRAGLIGLTVVLVVGVVYAASQLIADLAFVHSPSIFPFVILGVALLIALGFEFVNGFHDTANAVATVIYTHTLDPHVAVAWSGMWNFIGVLVSTGTVAFGIVSLLPVELILQVGQGAGFAMVFALLAAAILWNLGTWWFGLPSSSSHTLIGSIVGVGLANQILSTRSGTSGVDWGQAANVGKSLLISPIVGFVCAATPPRLDAQGHPEQEALHRSRG